LVVGYFEGTSAPMDFIAIPRGTVPPGL